jgi:hypothetical protein
VWYWRERWWQERWWQERWWQERWWQERWWRERWWRERWWREAGREGVRAKSFFFPRLEVTAVAAAACHSFLPGEIIVSVQNAERKGRGGKGGGGEACMM